MTSCRSALLVCTGDRRVGEELLTWLTRHGVSVVCCDDAFDACATLVTNPSAAPELAFVGTRWLDADDSALLTYIRQNWPTTGIVLYGDDRLPADTGGGSRMYVCRSPAAVREMLSDTPAALLERLIGRPAAAKSQTARKTGAEATRKERASPAKGKTETPKPPAGAAAPRESAPVDGGDNGAPPGTDAIEPDALLTAEELAALLEDDSQ